MSAIPIDPPPAVWGVGRLVLGDGTVVPWPVSQADIEDETASMAEHLRALDVGPGDLVLFVSLLSQAIHVFPWEQAAGVVGARYSSADATPFDAFRTAALTRQLGPKAVVGINADVVAGLAELGHDLAELFGGVSTVVASDDGAAATLSAAGLTPRRWRHVGPTSALDCAERAGVHVDGERWRVESDDEGRVLLTSLVPRLTPCDRLDTGVRGDVVHRSCSCGRAGPRIA